MPLNASAKTIVIIDDDDTILSLYYVMLSREGFRVVPFRSATDALSKINAKKYKIDLLLLDLMMPGIGGYDLVKKLQESETYKKVPILVISARTLDPETVELIRNEPNVKEFFSKPVDTSSFPARIHEILDTRRSAPAGDAE